MKKIRIYLQTSIPQVIRMQELLIQEYKALKNSQYDDIICHLEDTLEIIRVVEKIDSVVLDDTKS